VSNPYLDRIAKRGSTGHGKPSEQRVAKSLAARLMPGSGSTRGAKGDMNLDRKLLFKVEAKSTVNDTMRLELGWLVKVLTEALNTARHAALHVSFVTSDGRARPNGEWVMVPKHTFDELTEGR